jgi:hypothetical protein
VHSFLRSDSGEALFDPAESVAPAQLEELPRRLQLDEPRRLDLAGQQGLKPCNRRTNNTLEETVQGLGLSERGFSTSANAGEA